jgi:hypothetical protein
MVYVIAVCVLGTLLIFLAGIGVMRGYDIEVTFHPPVSFRVKITKVR